jgi:SecD/SecF fusion protein
MFIFGSDDIKGFCFALLIGVISGTYSTLFIAVPVVVDLGAEKKSAEKLVLKHLKKLPKQQLK